MPLPIKFVCPGGAPESRAHNYCPGGAPESSRSVKRGTSETTGTHVPSSLAPRRGARTASPQAPQRRWKRRPRTERQRCGPISIRNPAAPARGFHQRQNRRGFDYDYDNDYDNDGYVVGTCQSYEFKPRRTRRTLRSRSRFSAKFYMVKSPRSPRSLRSQTRMPRADQFRLSWRGAREPRSQLLPRRGTRK